MYGWIVNGSSARNVDSGVIVFFFKTSTVLLRMAYVWIARMDWYTGSASLTLLQLTLTLGFCSFSVLGSSCNDEQVRGCKRAVEKNDLNHLAGGGVCSKQQYVHYTHACTVSDYRNNVDYCCCALDTKVLCCRYHQAWDRFRCSEPEDTIAVITWGDPSSAIANRGPYSTSEHGTLPLKYLLPAIIGPLVLITCCFACCARKYYKWASYKRKRRKGDQATRTSVMNPTTMQGLTPYSLGRQVGAPETEPLSSGPLLAGCSDKPAITTVPEYRTSLEPSAPPAPDGRRISTGTPAPPYSACLGGTYPPHLMPYSDYSRQESCASASSNNYAGLNGGGRCPSCSAPSCAPPAYEESLQHEVVQQQ